MTNREYMESLSNEELVDFIYDKFYNYGKNYADSRSGMSNWLNEQYVDYGRLIREGKIR